MANDLVGYFSLLAEIYARDETLHDTPPKKIIMNNILNKHLMGIEFFRFPDLESLNPDGYFECLDLLRPLFKRPDFKNSTPGFYINYITNPQKEGDDDKNSVRLTYFTINPTETEGAIKNFAEINSDKIRIYESSKNTKRPGTKDLSDCEPELLRFRKFLNACTQIGLDLLQNFGRLCTRRLVTEYRLNCHPHTPVWVIRAEQFFGAVFNKHSQFFRSLDEDYSAKHLWEDLDRLEPSRVWLHYFINMLLPGDWNTYGYVIPEELKRGILESKFLDLPDNWKLDCDF